MTFLVRLLKQQTRALRCEDLGIAGFADIALFPMIFNKRPQELIAERHGSYKELQYRMLLNKCLLSPHLMVWSVHIFICFRPLTLDMSLISSRELSTTISKDAL